MNIGIYGLGRFGYFWAKVLTEKFTVFAYNRSPGKPVPEGVEHCTLDELFHCDAVFLCVSISSFQSVVRSIAPLIPDETLIIDTCSVKTYPVRVLESELPQTVPYLATHPMFGPDSGADGVRGLPLVYCGGRCSRDQAEFWQNAFAELGLSVLPMSPEEHDREAAVTQGITHFIGRVLDQLDLKKSQIGTKGYHSLLEIVEQTCNDPLQLFFDLQRFNPYTHDMRIRLKESIEKTMDYLSKADIAGDDH